MDTNRERLERLLDKAIADTFPASDPFTLSVCAEAEQVEASLDAGSDDLPGDDDLPVEGRNPDGDRRLQLRPRPPPSSPSSRG